MATEANDTAVTVIPKSKRLALDLTPSQMLAVAVQRGDPIETLNKLMDLQDRWDSKQARLAFDAAISGAKGEIKPIIKNRRVDFQNRNSTGRTQYEYEDLAAIAEHIDPILARYGLSYRHRPRQENARLFVTCILSHKDGHSEETTLDAPYDTSGNKSPAQGIMSTGTLLQRYTLKMALGLAAAMDDDDGQLGRDGEEAGEQDHGPRINAEQVKELETMLAGMNLAGFLKWAQIERLQDIPARAFETVKLEINARKGKGGTAAPQRRSAQQATPTRITQGQADDLRGRADHEGVSERELLRRYDLGSIDEMNSEQLALALQWMDSLNP